MIGGNPNDFLDRIYSCQDTVYIYNGIKYWFQGYMPNKDTVHMEVFQYQPAKEDYIWEYDGKTIAECWKSFVNAPIFEGKSFWNVEQQIEWVDE